MVDDREKLVGIMGELPSVFCDCCGEDYLQNKMLWLADHLIANGVTVQQMTPITEEIPTGECLAVNDCDEYMVGKIVKDPYSTATGYACMSDFGGTEVGIGDVTHWQHLPKPPKGVNHA